VIIFNMGMHSLQNAVNATSKQAKSGKRHEIGANHRALLMSAITNFRMVDPTQYREDLGYVIWFYEGMNFPAVQVFWPDETGHFPWSENSDGWISTTQPRLDLPQWGEKRDSL
jgi:hypothetical protein